MCEWLPLVRVVHCERQGDVSYLFDRQGYILLLSVMGLTIDEDAMLEKVLEVGGENLPISPEDFEIYTPPEDFSVRDPAGKRICACTGKTDNDT